jgi:PIN domain nuclease of toxin-antitoxin system
LRLLLDTHALLFWLFDDDRLSKTARALIAEPTHEVFVSAASAYEIVTKHRIGKLDAAKVLANDVGGHVERAGFRELPIRVVHAERAAGFSAAHKDPFDRLIAAQSVIEGMPVVGRDDAMRLFGVSLLW